MSLRYKGAVISATPPTTTGGDTGTASGAWTLQQQMQAQSAGLWPTQPLPPYIDDVFSTYLYTGNGTSQTITNGIDLAGKGGLVWNKKRNGVENNYLYDTVRGVNSGLVSNNTDAAADYQVISSFNSNGFTDSYFWTSSETVASWTFRKQAKFFDVVTYTGNGSNRTIAHNLGSVPGCIIIKCTSTTTDWQVYHRSLSNTEYLVLNSTAAKATGTTVWNSTTPTSSVFSLGTNATVNASGQTYVAYLFAHNAGGFGPTETDNVISCGTWTENGSGNYTINLGYEPQWVLAKPANKGDRWNIIDNMRGFPDSSIDKFLNPNETDAEYESQLIKPTPTGFQATFDSWGDAQWIYIAIRRTMKPPTTGTSVFQPVAYTGAGTPTTVNSSNQVDFYVAKRRGPTFSDNTIVQDRLRGSVPILVASDTRAEEQAYNTTFSRMTGIVYNVGDGAVNSSGATYVNWAFTRRTKFMDEVCYTGNGTSGRTVSHNLGVAPEFMFIKQRSGTNNWICGGTILGVDGYLFLNGTDALDTQPAYWSNTLPTSTNFTIDTATAVNNTSQTYVAYLFATLAGVSKVGSYTGNGGTQAINAGFTGGARFLLAKRTDASGAWFCWDSARGFTSGSSPYLRWNDGASAETTGNNGTYASTGGFTLTSSSPVNDNGGTYIYLAIA